LSLGGARLDRDPDGEQWTVNASRLKVGGHFSATKAVINGQVRLISARIGGVLNLREARICAPGKVCLQGERLEVGESLWLTDAAISGRVLLAAARVGGGADFKGARFTEPQVMTETEALRGIPMSLRTSRMKVGYNLVCGYGFEAAGAVWLDVIDVGGVLTFRDAVGAGPGQQLNLAGSSAKVIDLAFRSRPTGELNLENTRTVVLIDDAETWPARITLDGLTYARLQPIGEVPVERRIDWLRRGPARYSPQPYEQLSTTYRNAGQEDEARRISYMKQRARRTQLALPGRLWNLVLQGTVGYGYRPWLAGCWIIALIAAGWVAFQYGEPVAVGDRPPPFSAPVYAADLLLPIANLGEEGAWRFTSWLKWLALSYVLAGWVLTTALVAGVTRVFNAK
jgi:hypothetical protein